MPTADQPLKHGALVLLARQGEGAEVDEGLQQQVVNILVVLHDGLEHDFIDKLDLDFNFIKPQDWIKIGSGLQKRFDLD